MSRRLRNTLAAERHRLGWSQLRMAEAAGISRQAYAAIESGSSVPSTEVSLRLSAALGRPIADLFRLVEGPGELRPAAWGGVAAPGPGQRVRLTRIAGRWIAHPCAEAHRSGMPADGVVEGIRQEVVDVRLLTDAPRPAGLTVVGCDPAFGVVVDVLERDRETPVSWIQRGSRAALVALARGEAHVAGVHLRDSASGGWNGPLVRQLVPFPCTRISFAVWEQGLLVRPDAAHRIAGIEDLASRGARLINREVGSGSRTLLDAVLAKAGVAPDGVEGYATAAAGHFAVADAIAAGAADAGIAIRAAGRARGLRFLPLREEPYELVVPDHFLDLPAVGALLGVLLHPGVRAQVEAMGGYDGEAMGQPLS